MSRPLFISVLMVALISLLAGGGLFAYFSDTVTSENNTFQAGTIRLGVIWNQGEYPVYVDAKPCIWTTLEADELENEGDNAGRISMHIDVTDWLGGLFPDAEQALDPDNSCDIQDYLEIIITDLPQSPPGPGEPSLDGLLSIIQGAPDVYTAISLVEAYDLANGTTYAAHLLYMGLFDDFDCEWKALGTLNPGDIVHIGIVVHLRSRGAGLIDNIMQGDQAVFDKQYRLTQFLCDDEPGGGKTQSLPPFPTPADPNPPTSRIRVTYPGPASYWNARFLSLPPGDWDVETGTDYLCWCIDQKHALSTITERDVYLMSSLNPQIYSYSINWGYNPPVEHVFNFVNYLINTYDVGGSYPGIGVATLSMNEMQNAIWWFIDGVTFATIPADSKKVVVEVLLNGGTFQPETGQVALVVAFDATTNTFQILGIEVDP